MIGWRMLFGSCFFFFNDTATTEIYTLSLHDALPIYGTETKHCRGTFIVEDTPTQAVLVTTDLVVEESTVDDGEFAFVFDTTSLSVLLAIDCIVGNGAAGDGERACLGVDNTATRTALIPLILTG